MKAPLLRAAALMPLCIAVPSLAQESDGADRERGDAPVIIVTGRGLEDTPATPAYGTVEVDRETVLTVPSGRIEEALASVAGFQQFRRSDSRSSNPTAQGVTLRALGGNATSRALVTLDGVPVADPFFGYVPFAALLPEQVGRIAVTRGGGSGPFGAGALAGTIAIESLSPDRQAPFGASVLANDRGGTEAAGQFAAPLGGGYATGAIRWDRGPGFFTAPEDQRVPASVLAKFDSVSGQLRAVAPLAQDLELQARVLAFDDARTLRFEGADSSASGQDYSIRIVGRGRWQVDALGYVQARNFSNLVVSSSRFVPVLDQRSTPSTGLGGKLEVRPPVGPAHTLRLGVDYRRAEGELQEEPISSFTGNVTARRRAGGVTSDLGLFVEDDWEVGQLVLTGGLRADRTVIADGFFTERDAAGALVEDNRFADRSDWTLTYRAGALFRAGPTLDLRAAAYSGLRLPTLNELYRPFVVFPVVTQANAALANEELRGFEAGLDWRPVQGVAFSLTAFDNRLENAIANVTIGENLRQRRNLPAIETQGIEAGLRVARGPIRFDGSLSYSDPRIEGEGASLSLDGNAPPQSPRWFAAASLTYEPKPDTLLSLTLRHVGDQFEDDQESDILPAFTTLGAYAQLPLVGQLDLVLRAENLFDEEVVTRVSGGDVDLGAPRTLWAGVRYGF
ncbi:TonB-dependent receptor [Alteriqipengyuania lutimaris]|uniref:TonB-dependent receptor n=1 Tax=Alteriqipengyuania lutimaris TaxID=1538146 RepID=A0A395LJY7_9SPHN|nr:TonB-dependent receptor [Alteriqipengyuania lutimaris]MBB3033931.1 outer membrane receptor protein involved in Fe transport [Alteriqipengyuania lutimaris]RDS77111.1 TonB-dependent receptor [Alteriqipengyuania lutimaris]